VPLRNRAARIVLRPVFRGLFHILGKVEIQGLNHVPHRGAYLVAPNHVSIFDGPFVLSFWPCALEFAGAVDIWDRKGQSLLARLYGGIKVHRGQFDRSLIDKTLSLLDSGHPLLIAPEGGRSHQPGLRKANPGVAYLADKAQVPVIPVGVHGCTEDFFSNGVRGKRQIIAMNIGQPLRLPEIRENGESRRAMRQQNADYVMAHIARLLPENYRGYYASHSLLHPCPEP
jgi:1-acyl-sn-glycerol-3-phosphate acyltransferase